MRAAAIRPDRVGAGASWHGGGLTTDKPDSPHLLAPKIKAEMVFGVAQDDDAKQPESKTILKKAMDNAGVKANLCRMLMEGRLGGTGKMIILPVDQGFEHGPARSFAVNPAAYDPHYHYQLAIDAGLNAFASPLGMIEAGADTFAGQIPTILKVNSSNSLVPASARACITSSRATPRRVTWRCLS